MATIILGIESSCDDTSAAILADGRVLSNVTASQNVHLNYGGVVPELASRAHQQNIIPVVDGAIKQANIELEDIDAIAFTRGPGLMGSLLVGVSFAKGFALARNLKMLEINHLQAHVSAHFIVDAEQNIPKFPFLCLLVSGGNSQILLVKDYMEMEIIGQTIDDAAGEAFDKCAKSIGLGYPGGPIIDKLAKLGNPTAFNFSKPRIADYNYSFSGLKTSFLYTVRDELKVNPNFIEERKNDLCASLQKTVVDILIGKLLLSAKTLGISRIALAGGVSANSALRQAFEDMKNRYNYQIYLPKFSYTTDNAAMVASAGFRKYQKGLFCDQNVVPFAHTTI